VDSVIGTHAIICLDVHDSHDCSKALGRSSCCKDPKRGTPTIRSSIEKQPIEDMTNGANISVLWSKTGSPGYHQVCFIDEDSIAGKIGNLPDSLFVELVFTEVLLCFVQGEVSDLDGCGAR
jgi:hypothetical protein